MKRFGGPLSVVILLLAAGGCARRAIVPSVRIPPRIDLTQHELIGVVDFRTTSEGELASLATRRFTEWARRDQGTVRMVEFGTRAETLRSIGKSRWDREAFQALGREHGIQTILTGQLTISDVRPDLRLAASLRAGEVTALVDATLEVQMIEAATGASIWSSSGRATHSVGHISVVKNRGFAFDAEDPERAYGGLVDALVEQVTRDFRATVESR